MATKDSHSSLSVSHPDIAREWHPEMNGGLDMTTVSAGSSKKAWWKCQQGPDHEWEAPISRRSQGLGCPYCAGKKASVTNSLKTLFPQLILEWHAVKNGDLTPDTVVAGSNKKIWWKCPESQDHEWQSAISSRAGGGKGCPFCRGFSVSTSNSLRSFSEELSAEWHPSKNGEITPDLIVAGSNKKAWWKCSQGPDHEWQAVIESRARGGRGCPFCHGLSVSITNSLRSFSKELSNEWHAEKNGDDTPDTVMAGSHRKGWWKCPQGPDHVWQAQIWSRASGGRGCPFCRGFLVSVTNSLRAVSKELSSEWHPSKNGGLTPDMVVAGTNKKAWWKCPKGPDHEWESTLDKRSNAGRGCPFCAGKAASITNSLSSLFPDLIPNWHPTKNGDLTPYDVVAQSHKKIWWQCQLAPNHEWQAVIQSRSTGGNGCPHCTLYPRSRQEIDLAFELLFFFDFDIDDHKENLEGRIYDCDIIIRQHQLVVEFDGSYFHDGRDRADKSKTSKLQTEGWRVIRVREEPLSLISPMDVSVPLNLNMKPAADAVLLKIREALGIPIEGLDDYLDLSERQNARASERFIRRSLKLAENTG